VSDPKHWLYRPENWPRLWQWGGVLLLLSVSAEFFVDTHAKFAFANWFAFSAVFGFISCLAMVLFAKWLGGGVKRPEDYYGSAQDDATVAPNRVASNGDINPEPDQGGTPKRHRS